VPPDFTDREQPPKPWAEGEKIPWNEPAFSERMLLEHLSQEHDAASRRAEKIGRHVEWIHDHLLNRTPSSVLDLGCGPGLYATRLARMGHDVTGIDFSPASIRYAREAAKSDGLTCRFVLGDIRDADYAENHDLAMLIFGEFNVFRPGDASRILARAGSALTTGGQLLLEVYLEEAVRRIGSASETRQDLESGLFSDRPHEYVTQNFWDEATRTATLRFIVTDAETGAADRHAQTMQAYTEAEYREILRQSGFGSVDVIPSLTGEPDESERDLYCLVARR
jgi:SAM-dependent methyltransferase